MITTLFYLLTFIEKKNEVNYYSTKKPTDNWIYRFLFLRFAPEGVESKPSLDPPALLAVSSEALLLAAGKKIQRYYIYNLAISVIFR